MPLDPSLKKKKQLLKETTLCYRVKGKMKLSIQFENIILCYGTRANTEPPDNEPSSEKSIVSQPSKMQIDCFNKMAICTKNSRTFNCLNSKSGVKISIPSRIWNSIFAEDMPDSVDSLSHAETKIINAKYLHQEQETNDISNIRTRVVKDPKLMKEQRSPIWIIILAIVGGLLLLLIIILICAKLGFFRRKRQVNRANHYRPPRSRRSK